MSHLLRNENGIVVTTFNFVNLFNLLQKENLFQN